VPYHVQRDEGRNASSGRRHTVVMPPSLSRRLPARCDVRPVFPTHHSR